MTQFPLGLIALIIVSILIYFGLAQRVLDKLRLSDRAALIIIGVLIVGSFITIPITRGNYEISLNIGGGLVPIVLAGYLLSKADSAVKWVRAILATLVTAAVIYGAGTLFGGADTEPGGRFFGVLDSIWAYPLIAGIVGYLAGRSRRSAFIAATLGIVLLDIGYMIWLLTGGAPAGTVAIGGAGAFDVIVLSGIFAVLLAEVIGEIRERVQGGPSMERRSSPVVGLKKPMEDDEESLNKGDSPRNEGENRGGNSK